MKQKKAIMKKDRECGIKKEYRERGAADNL